MATLTDVNNLKEQIQASADRVKAYQAEVSKYDALAIEYNRQSIYHASQGNYDDSQIAAQRRESAIGQRDAANAKRVNEQNNYNSLQTQFEAALNALAPDEKNTFIKQEQALTAGASTQNTIAFIQGTTKYLIFAAIALVVIIGTIIIFRKKYAA
jgi:hypothetical protein